ncbi:hypothetical protein DIS24_g9929 [Lasiodiplodia hormozganensis]|uniref:Uncharacterized protein n=1 Tax=Lasiodiplodia hormozganensis TaxID=869390 RepID=A0AA39XRY9_9PEZI|nr:hypothetical protein DIS24_g9929 [Lasiodiplodia hormozganensis]
MSFLTRLLPFPSQPAPRPQNTKPRIFYNPPDADPDRGPPSSDSADSEVDDLLALFPRPSLTRPPPPMRLTLTPKPHVYGFPPSGGVLVLTTPAPADLEFLGLPAIPAEEIPPPPLEKRGREEEEEEEAFCERMRLLGAQWWKEGEAEMRRAERLRGRYRLDADGLDLGGLRTVRIVAVGFEAGAIISGAAEGGGGGVWVYRERWGQREEAKFRRRDERRREDDELGRDAVDHEARRRGRHARRRERREEERRIVRVAAARTMEERCRVIRECEGEYFESVEAWRKVVMEEHVREGVLAPDRDRLFRKTYEDGYFL